MLIVCPNCATSYRVEPSSLGHGRSVRCVRCRSVWFATPPEPAPDAETAASTYPLANDEPAAPTEAGPSGFLPDQPSPFDPGPIEARDAVDGQEAPLTSAQPRFDLPATPDPAAIGTTGASEGRERIAASVKDPPEDIESFAARRLKRRQAQGRGPWAAPILPTTIVLLLVANIILIGWRSDVVKILPQTASLYAAIGLPVNLRGLVFTDVTSTTESHDGVPVLVVAGTIAATSKRVVEVPRLRISLRNASGHEVYAWTALPERSVLSPGETLAFRSRLASPPADGHDVIVRFFNRRDLVAGLQ